MIPIRDTQPISQTPVICYGLISLTIMVFFAEIHLDFTGELSDWVGYWGMIPGEITRLWQQAISSDNPAVWVAFLWRCFAILPALFLHYSYAQILGNLIFLYVFGKRLESQLGRFPFLGFYLIGGIVAGIIRIFLDPEVALPIVGANGAIAAILGAYVIKFPKAKIETLLPLLIIFIPIQLPAAFYLFWWFVQQFSYAIGSLNLHVNPLTPGYVLQQILAMGWGMAIASLHRKAL
ncbi:hypothetical protein BI308_00010 [Roseofilum reptotaenium AO1-A]|uniref:Peptidase S54 rhomboid domain-containing protein n=1 Tax=Roseofilum reptotaenium AO1-A TaxID=1925591 RepID=A0A1L9QXM2_9CYAN|nr:rhomboid family intramembrane serine protease [Roseofilum reptotaenium]OJJ27403.1 hypothetical protein BI308_00010 [Roseofilum reptotaenium AO1-A]